MEIRHPINHNFNLEKCHARLTKDPNKQCTNNPKPNCNLCGIHTNSKLLVTDLIQAKPSIHIVKKNSKPVHEFDASSYTRPTILIQKIWRGYSLRKHIKNYGIASIANRLLNNDTEFLTFENTIDIPYRELFTYRDQKGFYWGFRISTFKELISHSTTNPYNTLEIGTETIERFNRLVSQIDKTINLNIEKPVIADPNIKLQQRCIEIFQKMDELKQYTQCEWFLSLNLNSLKYLYKEMADIWHHRLGLSNLDKRKYITNGILFNIPIIEISKIADKYKISHILLDEYEKLVTNGQNLQDRTTGALWVLSGLTLVSQAARNAMPWLYESVRQ